MRAFVVCALLLGAGCKHSTAVPASCVDRLHDGDESDVDCGGAFCPGCVAGRGQRTRHLREDPAPILILLRA